MSLSALSDATLLPDVPEREYVWAPLAELNCRVLVLIYEPACTDEVLKLAAELFCVNPTSMVATRPS